MGVAFELVMTPTVKWLGEKLENCTSRFFVASPFVGPILTDIISRLPGHVEKRLVTRTDLRHFAEGASSVETLCDLAANAVSIRRLPRLHAKVYVVDDRSALVTSANATFAGLKSNMELGLATGDHRIVSSIVEALNTGFGAEEPPKEIQPSDLEALKSVTQISRSKQLGAFHREKPLEMSEEPPPIEILDKDSFLGSFRGWRRYVLEALSTQMPLVFNLDEIEAAVEPLVDGDPDLDYKRPTLRRTLQEIRDIGLLEFVDYRGTYRRTFEII